MVEEVKEKISPKSPKQAMILNTQADTAIVGGAMGCFDSETEYLSQDGWKKFEDYNEEDLVAQYSQELDGVEFVAPSLYMVKEVDTFYHIKTQHVDQMITENHSVIYWKEDGNHFYNLPAHVLHNYGNFSGRFKVHTEEGFSFSDVTKKDIVEVSKKDKAYCFSVPSGMLLIRRNGKISISGNSGKSYIALLFPLKYSEDPYFRGVIFRKTTGELTAQGGLWETAVELYNYVFGEGACKVGKKDLKVTFPTGASVKFSHMERDDNRFAHMGAQYTFILFDEATHFSKLVIEYLGLRIRSARAKHKMQMILTCNPDPDWFGLEWIRPYLLEDGTPNKSMDGVIRYYVVDDGNYVWSDSLEELESKYGAGEESGIKTFTFISASCYDNPVLLKNDRSYISRLKSKPFVDVQRYLYGNWLVRPSNSGFFRREWVIELVEPPPHTDFVKIVRAYDFAAVLPSDQNRNPDYTASVKMGKLKSGEYVILEVTRTRIRFGDWKKHVLENAARDGNRVDIVIPQDPNAQAKANSVQFANSINDAGFGYHCTYKKSTTSKLESFRPFSATAQNGSIFVLANCGIDYWNKVHYSNDFFLNEMEAFTGERKNTESGHDDVVDACSLAYIYLASKARMPSASFLHGINAATSETINSLLQIR